MALYVCRAVSPFRASRKALTGPIGWMDGRANRIRWRWRREGEQSRRAVPERRPASSVPSRSTRALGGVVATGARVAGPVVPGQARPGLVTATCKPCSGRRCRSRPVRCRPSPPSKLRAGLPEPQPSVRPPVPSPNPIQVPASPTARFRFRLFFFTFLLPCGRDELLACFVCTPDHCVGQRVRACCTLSFPPSRRLGVQAATTAGRQVSVPGEP